MKMNSFFLMVHSFVLLAFQVKSIYCASTGGTGNSEKENLVQSGNLLDSTSAIGSTSTTEYGKMMQFLDDNYQFTHQGVQDYLGIKALTDENIAKRLQQACFFGNIKAIQQMIKEGVDIRMHNDMAIKTAADMNHNHIVKGLFNYGCNSQSAIEHILNSAARNGNYDLVQFALGTGKCPKYLKNMAIAEAARFGNLDIVKIFFNSAVSTDGLCNYLAKLAHVKGFTDIMNFFKDNGWYVMNNNNALIWGSKFGHIEVVKLLLEKGADVHAKDDCALRQACMNCHIEVVKLLLDNDANVHANNDCALKWASQNGHTEVFKLLLEKGADIHACNYLALQWASYNGHPEIVKLLLDKDSNVHADNDYALLWASYNGHAKVVKLLLDKDANVHAEDDFALRWASENGHTEVVKLLLEKDHTISHDNH